MIVKKNLDAFNKVEYITQEDLNPHEIEVFYSSFNEYLNIIKIEKTGILLIKRKTLQQYVGVINFKNKIIINIASIIPVEKIFQIWVLTYNNLDFTIYDEILNYKSSESSLEYIIELYYNYLGELLKKGLNKIYKDYNLNIKSLKEKININQTKINYYKNFKFNINCSFKVLVEDNLLNQIIKFCLLRLIGISNEKLKSKGKKFLYYFQKVTTLRKINLSAFNQLSYNRLNKKYEIIHIISKFIIQNSTLYEREGDFKFFTFLMDINKLFEDFVFNVIDKYKPSEYNVPKYRRSFNRENEFELKPDIIIKKDDQVVLALDCKFKPRIGREDKFQIVTYGNYFNFNKGILIYPKNKTEIDDKYLKIGSLRINQLSNTFLIIIKLIDLKDISTNALSKFTSDIFELIKIE